MTCSPGLYPKIVVKARFGLGIVRRVLGLVALLSLAVGMRAEETIQRRWTEFAYPASFEHISTGQGLSQSLVHAIVQDPRGFLWFGTNEGLNRYDGNRFLVFTKEETNPNSLPSNVVNALYVDRRGLLWVGTSRGLAYLDPWTLQFQQGTSSDRENALPTNKTNVIAEDKDGNLWVGTKEKGLYCLPASWKPSVAPVFQLISEASQKPKGPPPLLVTSLFLDGKGTFWVGTWDRGLYRMNPAAPGGKYTFDAFPPDPKNSESSPPANCYCMGEDALGSLWVGGFQGLFYCDPDRGIFRRYRHVDADPTSMPSDIVFSILRDSKGGVWIANDQGGLSKMLPRQAPTDPPKFQYFQHDPKDPKSISSDGLQYLFEDRSGVLWASCFRKGLNKLLLNPSRKTDREKPSVLQFRNNAADPLSLTGNIVTGLVEDRFGNLWVATDGFGLNRVLLSSPTSSRMKFERYRAQRGTPGALQGDVINSMHVDSNKELWLGTYRDGLVHVELSTPTAKPRFTYYKHDAKDPASLSDDYIQVIQDDGSGRLYVGFNSGSVDLFDPKTGKAKHIQMKAVGISGGQGGTSITALVMDSFHTLWVGRSSGLARYNSETGECKGYTSGGAGTLSNPSITTLKVDSKGNLWVGTKGGGLNKATLSPWNAPEPVFKRYGLQDGLPSKVVNAIAEDQRGQLWLSMDRHLYRFDPAEGRAYPFTYQSELETVEFSQNSVYRSSSGEIFFGSNDGLTIFHPNDIVPNPIAPEMALTDFQLFNKSVPLTRRMREDPGEKGVREITLFPGESVFSFDFAALHFVAPDQNQYAYKLEGIDKGWNEMGSQHFISYTTLPPGEYVMKVRGSNCDGLWSNDPLQLKIRMLPHWYQTWWFKTLLVSLLAGGVYSFFRIRIRVLQTRNRQLEEVVSARTIQLQEAVNALEEMSLTDPLTGLRNRRFLSVCMPKDVAQVARQQRDAAIGGERMKQNIDVLIILVDIDHFKYVNDTYGHQAGDMVLTQLGGILKEAVRATDTVIRWGGEEFLIIARHTARADAVTLPERIRSAVEAFPFDIGGSIPLHRTCSVGFSVFPLLAQEMGLLSWEQITEIADTCMFAAKANGRNAWVGIIPDASLLKTGLDGKLPTNPSKIAKSGLFPVITSFSGPIKW